MKILIASTPATGRLNPLLAIGHILIAEGHEVVGLSGSALRERIENVGAEFRPLPEGTDFDLRDILSVAPELKDIPPGPYRSRGGIRNLPQELSSEFPLVEKPSRSWRSTLTPSKTAR